MLTLIVAVLAVFVLLGALASGALTIVVLLLKILWPFVLIGFVVKMLMNVIKSKKNKD